MAVKTAEGMTADPNTPPPEAARQFRSAAFRAMSEQADQFMRSPQFLEYVKQSLNAAIRGREQLNEFLTRMHHEVQSVARQDIDTVLCGIHQLESRVVERLEEIGRRLDDMDRRMAAQETGTRRANQKRTGRKNAARNAGG